MPEQPILFRQWSILRTLGARHHGATVEDLAHEMGVSGKTIRRDLELFRTLGFPVTEEKGYRGLKKWRMDASALTPITFTFEEALALTMGRRGLDPLKGTLFWDAANSAMKKIRASLRDDVVDYINRHAGSIHQTMLGVNDYSEKKDMLEQIIQAMEERRMIIINYQPESFWRRRGAWWGCIRVKMLDAERMMSAIKRSWVSRKKTAVLSPSEHIGTLQSGHDTHDLDAFVPK